MLILPSFLALFSDLLPFQPKIRDKEKYQTFQNNCGLYSHFPLLLCSFLIRLSFPFILFFSIILSFYFSSYFTIIFLFLSNCSIKLIFFRTKIDALIQNKCLEKNTNKNNANNELNSKKKEKNQTFQNCVLYAHSLHQFCLFLFRLPIRFIFFLSFILSFSFSSSFTFFLVKLFNKINFHFAVKPMHHSKKKVRKKTQIKTI